VVTGLALTAAGVAKAGAALTVMLAVACRPQEEAVSVYGPPGAAAVKTPSLLTVPPPLTTKATAGCGARFLTN
jgi:hypothetical protein